MKLYSAGDVSEESAEVEEEEVPMVVPNKKDDDDDDDSKIQHLPDGVGLDPVDSEVQCINQVKDD